jgi:hypothetical protein
MQKEVRLLSHSTHTSLTTKIMIYSQLLTPSYTLLVTISICGQITQAAATVTTEIRGTLKLPEEAKAQQAQLNTTRLTLNDGEYYTYTKSDGSFVFYDVGPGVHLLDVQSTIHLFPHVKIQLLETAMNNPKCIEYAFPGASKQAIPYNPPSGIVLTALAKYEYFERRKGFNVFMLLKNPMVLMMLVSVGLMFCMPKMMEGLDPEQQAKFRKQMENQGDPAQMLTSMFQDLSEATGGAGGDESDDQGKLGSAAQAATGSAAIAAAAAGSANKKTARRSKRH